MDLHTGDDPELTNNQNECVASEAYDDSWPRSRCPCSARFTPQHLDRLLAVTRSGGRLQDQLRRLVRYAVSRHGLQQHLGRGLATPAPLSRHHLRPRPQRVDRSLGPRRPGRQIEIEPLVVERIAGAQHARGAVDRGRPRPERGVQAAAAGVVLAGDGGEPIASDAPTVPLTL